MKKLINLTALFAVIAVATTMIGCGGGDDDHQDAPQDTGNAPATLANRTITIIEDGRQSEYVFAAAGNTFQVFEPGATTPIVAGNYQYTRLSADTGQLVVTTTDDQGVQSQVTYQIAWTGPQTGTFTWASSAGTTGSGTFINFREVTPPNGDPGNGDPGNGDPGNGDPGEVPTTLAGRAVDFTSGGGGNERLTFGQGGTVTSDVHDPPVVGNYTYTLTGANTATLVVNFPAVNENYNLTMNFTAPRTGTWSGTQFYQGTDHPVAAGSTFTVQGN
jgi:hypothetical protein